MLTAKDGANSDGLAKNRTGILWYRMAYGGFGQQSYDNEWEYRIQGVIRGIRPVIVAKIMDFNVIDLLRQMYAVPPLDIEAGTVEDAIAVARRIRFGMGAVVPHTSEERITPMQLPDVPKVIFDEMMVVDEAIEGHAWPQVLKGLGPTETASGAAQRLSQGKAGLGIAKRQLEQLWEGMLMDICMMVKYELEEPLHLRSGSHGMITLDPDDIVDGMRIIYDSAPSTAEEKAFERREQITLKQEGLRSVLTLLTADPDVPDPAEEIARGLADQAVLGLLPLIQQEVAQRMMPQPAAAPVEAPMEAPSSNGSGPLLAPSETMQARNPTPGLPPLTRTY